MAGKSGQNNKQWLEGVAGAEQRLVRWPGALTGRSGREHWPDQWLEPWLGGAAKSKGQVQWSGAAARSNSGSSGGSSGRQQWPE